MAPTLRAINYKLKDVTIRGAGAKSSPYKLADGGGLYVEVMTTGAKFWRGDGSGGTGRGGHPARRL